MYEKGKKVLTILEEAGFEAYFVGGYVRDIIMKKEGNDIDIATSARPQQVIDVFRGFQVIETGLKHGTVTVIMEGEPFEITTYRDDGTYSDGRHPDAVKFVYSIEEDLARRDFTMNAIAADKEGNIVDPFGGRDDISRKIIRAVGDPQRRFQEDALRIMRALRFSAVTGFEIEENTEKAMIGTREKLGSIAAERIFAELKKLIVGKNAPTIVRRYIDVLGVVIPELLPMKNMDQKNPHHIYDVLEHSIRAMEAVETNEKNCEYMKMAALLHDVGKTKTFTVDEAGIGHFFGHAKRSEQLVSDILTRLKADGSFAKRTTILVKYHDLNFENDPRLVKRWMNKFTEEVLRELVKIKRADYIGQGTVGPEAFCVLDDVEEIISELLQEEVCFSVRSMEVTGRDLMDIGIEEGPEIGRILNLLLELVMDDKIPNEKSSLLEKAAQLKA